MDTSHEEDPTETLLATISKHTGLTQDESRHLLSRALGPTHHIAHDGDFHDGPASDCEEC